MVPVGNDRFHLSETLPRFFESLEIDLCVREREKTKNCCLQQKNLEKQRSLPPHKSALHFVCSQKQEEEVRKAVNMELFARETLSLSLCSSGGCGRAASAHCLGGADAVAVHDA